MEEIGCLNAAKVLGKVNFRSSALPTAANGKETNETIRKREK